jgi:hypothetical protein
MTKRVVPEGRIAPVLAASLAASLALGLGACGESLYDKDEAPADTVEGDVSLEPGLYRMQVSIGGAGGGASGSQFADDTTCLTEADVAGGYREMLLDMQGRDSCRFDSYDLQEDGTLDAVMTCKGDQFQPETEARIEGTLSATATDLRMTVAGFEGGRGGIDMRVTSERIGDCPDKAN